MYDSFPKTAVLFPSAARLERLDHAERLSVPKDFFYGTLKPMEEGKPVTLCDTRQDPVGICARTWLYYERMRNRLSNFGLTRTRVGVLRDRIAEADIALSFTDGFSLSLGYYRSILPRDTVVAGGFHGLSDILNEVKPAYRSIARGKIIKGIRGLDHLFFFGEADRQEAIRRFGLDEDRTSLFLFGVDTGFWKPDSEIDGSGDGSILSIGSDPKRDYPTLIEASGEYPTHIISRLNVTVPQSRPNIELTRGSYHGSAVTDERLRQFYREASVVAIPIKDVFQPSGYSVCLQAMACGKPVVLSKIRGLWDSHLLRSGENCILVKPDDPQEMAEAIRALMTDSDLRKRIGRASLETAANHFGLDRMNESYMKLTARLTPACAERKPG